MDPKTGPVLEWLWDAEMIENGPPKCDPKSIKQVPKMSPKLNPFRNRFGIEKGADGDPRHHLVWSRGGKEG